MYDYDITVIGGGAAGLVASKLAAGLGKKTALIESNRLGGDCTWFGCVPSKALLRAAAMAHDFKHIGDFGIKTAAGVAINSDNVMAHVRRVVELDYQAILPEKIEQLGISLLFGSPEFIDKHSIKIENRIITSEKFIICTGSRAFIPEIEGLESIPYLTNATIFNLDKLPASMLIIGGGPIGIEMACALSRLGVEVNVIEKSNRILPREEPEFSNHLMISLRREGIKFQLECFAAGFSIQDNKINAKRTNKEGKTDSITADSVLVAVGRIPNIETLMLKNADVEFEKRGLITDEHLCTTAGNIYAAGDVVPPYLFSHIAEYEAIIAASNACLPIKRKVNYDNILWCTFTDPELAHAGLTELEAHQKYGDKIRMYYSEYSGIDRAKTDLTENGFAKFICDSKDRLVGIHILGHSAGELMHEAQLLKSFGLPFRKISSVIHAYPSYSDIVRFASRKSYIARLQNNPFIKLLKKFQPAKK